MAKKDTYVTFVLDETGSMQSIKDDTIGGFNQYLSTLIKTTPKARFSLLKFDSNRVEKVCVDTPVEKVKPLTPDTYIPGAMTPLIDACYKAIVATAEKVGKKKANVAITIQTDGHENASTEHSLSELAALIKEKTKAGWAFTFLGAGIDAFSQAAALGIAAGQTMSYDRHTSKAAFAAAASSTARYASSGVAGRSSFTMSERAATGGHLPKSEAPKTGHISAARRKSRERRKSVVDDFSL